MNIQLKKTLYENIMTKVSKIVKHALTEGVRDFEDEYRSMLPTGREIHSVLNAIKSGNIKKWYDNLKMATNADKAARFYIATKLILAKMEDDNIEYNNCISISHKKALELGNYDSDLDAAYLIAAEKYKKFRGYSNL